MSQLPRNEDAVEPRKDPLLSDHPIDLDAYFERIGYRGVTRPTLETLNRIVHRHVEVIPFENLDILLGRPIDLGPAALQQKLIFDRRGGYCFEQNGLLLLVLEALGFHVRPLSARVLIVGSRASCVRACGGISNVRWRRLSAVGSELK